MDTDANDCAHGCARNGSAGPHQQQQQQKQHQLTGAINNYLSRRPVRVLHIAASSWQNIADGEDGSARAIPCAFRLHTFSFIGACPLQIKTAIARATRSKSSSRATQQQHAVESRAQQVAIDHTTTFDTRELDTQYARNYFAPTSRSGDVARIIGLTLAQDCAHGLLARHAPRPTSISGGYDDDECMPPRLEIESSSCGVDTDTGGSTEGGTSKRDRDDDDDDDARAPSSLASDELSDIERALVEMDQEGKRASTTPMSRDVLAQTVRTTGSVSRPPVFEDSGFTPIYDLQIFPEDSFIDLKKKLFIATGIPIYRQHLVGISVASRRDGRGDDDSDTDPALVISYSLAGGARYGIDFRELYDSARPSRQQQQHATTTSMGADVSHAIFGIPVDYSIYDSRADLRVEARDHITMIGQARPTFFALIDLAEWIAPRIEKIRSAVADNYQFELLYYGFIVKYFPMLTRECFIAYINDEESMRDKYPDLAPSVPSVAREMRMQCEISRDTWASQARMRPIDMDHIIMRATVTSQLVTLAEARYRANTINLRDFFDSIVCSSSIVDVFATIDDDSAGVSRRETTRFTLRKIHKHSQLMSVMASAIAYRAIGIRIPSLGTEQGVVIVFSPRQITSSGNGGITRGSGEGRTNVAGTTRTSIQTSSTSPRGKTDVEQRREQYLQVTPLFLIVRANGRISFQKQWREEDGILFENMIEIFKRETSQLVRELRQSGVFAASRIEPITGANMRILDLTVATRWKRTISARAFRNIRDAWTDYARAGIVIPRRDTRESRDSISFIFTRGISNVDSQQVEQRINAAGIRESNHYAYLSVSAMRQKWNQTFAGRVVTVEHHATGVYFTAADIYEDEYAIFEMYLRTFVETFIRNNAASIAASATTDDETAGVNITEGEDAGSRAVLRRLQETDPVLYDLKKYGATRVYSTRCQHNKQPVLLTEQEVAARGVPNNATRYWNFTTRRPAYYVCPNARYPHLNFLTDIHPLGYCVPCCGMMQPRPDSKHAQITRICLRDRVYDVARLLEKPVNYVMIYGALDRLSEGRLSHLPSGALSDLINRTVRATHPDAEAVIFGVAQDIGVMRAISMIIGESMPTFATNIIRALDKNLINFDMLAGGRAITYFTSRANFVGYLARVAEGREVFPIGTGDFMRAILTECVREVYNLDLAFLVMPATTSTPSASSAMSAATSTTGDVAQIAMQFARGEAGIARPPPPGQTTATHKRHGYDNTYAPIERDARLIVPRHRRASEQEGRIIGMIVIGDGVFHPVLVINADDFARHGTIASRTIPPQCVASLFAAIQPYILRPSLRSIDFDFIRGFCENRRADGVAVKRIYVGTRGMCYAVLLAPWNAYIPIAYSSATSRPTGVASTARSSSSLGSSVGSDHQYDVARDSTLDDVRATSCLRAIDAINSYVADHEPTYSKMLISGYISVGANIIGYVIANGYGGPIPSFGRGVQGIVAPFGSGSRMIAYFSQLDIDRTHDEYRIITTVSVDPRKHTSSPDGAQSASNEIVARAERALYPYHEYELFCAQFVALCDTMRATDVRARMSPILRDQRASVASKTEKLRALGLTERDIIFVLNNETGLRTGNVSDSLDIDLTPFHQALSGSRDQLVIWLNAFMRPGVEQVNGRSDSDIGSNNDATTVTSSARLPTVPQIISSCANARGDSTATSQSPQSPTSETPAQSQLSHCSGKKLRIVTPLSRLVDILAADMRNPIKRAYIFMHGSRPESRSLFADFTQRSSEILIVKKYDIKI